jgi:hypothetical protein
VFEPGRPAPPLFLVHQIAKVDRIANAP